MKKTTIIVLALLAMATTACGQKKLTAEQKAIVAETVESAGRTHQAVPGASAVPLGAMNRFQALSWLVGARAATTTTDAKTLEMKDKLDDPAVCSVTYPTPVASTANSFDIKITVTNGTGGSCPISMNVAISGSGSANSATVNASLKYTVLDAEYKKLNDVDSFDIAGGITVSGSESASSASLDVNGDVSGNVHSQARGDIKFKLEADVSVKVTSSGSDGSGSVALILTYPDFEAELKQSFDGTTSKYEINGEEVTEAEFNAYFTKAGVTVPGSTTP